jgi:hypothetical protein
MDSFEQKLQLGQEVSVVGALVVFADEMAAWFKGIGGEGEGGVAEALAI